MSKELKAIKIFNILKEYNLITGIDIKYSVPSKTEYIENLIDSDRIIVHSGHGDTRTYLVNDILDVVRRAKNNQEKRQQFKELYIN